MEKISPQQKASYALAVLVPIATLITYKSGGALATLSTVQDTGTLSAKTTWLDTGSWLAWLQPFGQTLNYFSWVVIALTFGIVISAAVMTLLPSKWIQQSLGASGAKGQLFAAAAGSPLMLCSCCVAPVFEGVYRRTQRLGPALGLMFASPALNPAALAITFLLFPADIAWGRLLASLVLVIFVSAGLGRLFRFSETPELPNCEEGQADFNSLLKGFIHNLRDTAVRSIPAILLGAFLSVLVTVWLPIESVAGSWNGVPLILMVAALMLPLALPTFAEIPIALLLMQIGAPDGAVLAVLIAGPVVNLPSLLSLGRVVSAKAALVTVSAVYLVTAFSGIVIG